MLCVAAALGAHPFGSCNEARLAHLGKTEKYASLAKECCCERYSDDMGDVRQLGCSLQFERDELQTAGGRNVKLGTAVN